MRYKMITIWKHHSLSENGCTRMFSDLDTYTNNPFWKLKTQRSHWSSPGFGLLEEFWDCRIRGSTCNSSHLVEYGNLGICLNLDVDDGKVFMTTRLFLWTNRGFIDFLKTTILKLLYDALCLVFPHLQGYDVIASPLQRPRRSLASVLADLSCLHQVRVMLVGLVVVNGRLSQQAQQFSLRYTTCLHTAQPRMAATKRRAKLARKWRVSRDMWLEWLEFIESEALEDSNKFPMLTPQGVLEFLYNRWRKHAEAMFGMRVLHQSFTTKVLILFGFQAMKGQKQWSLGWEAHCFLGTAHPTQNVGIKDQEKQLVPDVVKQMLQDLGIHGISWFSCDRMVEMGV